MQEILRTNLILKLNKTNITNQIKLINRQTTIYLIG